MDDKTYILTRIQLIRNKRDEALNARKATAFINYTNQIIALKKQYKELTPTESV